MSDCVLVRIVCLQALDAGIDLTAVVAAFASSSCSFRGWFLGHFSVEGLDALGLGFRISVEG